MSDVRRTTGAMLLAIGVTGQLIAQASQALRLAPLPVDLVLRGKEFAEYAPMRFSPDGRWVAYTVRDLGSPRARGWRETPTLWSGVPFNADGADIWLTETRTGATRHVAGGTGNAWAPAWSPDGRWIAFLSDRAPRKQTAHDSAGGPLARLWLWDVVKGSMRLVAEVNVRGERVMPQWSADSRRVLVTLLPEGVTPAAYANRAAAPPSRTEDHAVPGSTVTVYRSTPSDTLAGPSGGGWRLDWPVDLGWVDIATGAVQRVVRDANIATVRLAPDGRTVAFTIANRFERPGSQQILYDLVVLAPGQPARVVAHDIRLNYDGAQFNWAPHGDRLAYRATGALATGDVYVVALDGSPPRLVTGATHPDWGRQAPSPLWNGAGTSVFVTDSTSVWSVAADGSVLHEALRLTDCSPMLLEQVPGRLWQLPGTTVTILLARDCEGAVTALYAGDVTTGAARRLTAAAQFIGGYGRSDGVAVSSDGHQVVYAAQDVDRPPDLYWASDSTFAAPRQLTHLNPALERYTMGDRRVITWRTLDGDTVAGVLLLPAGYTAGARYPLLTKIYGGDLPSRFCGHCFGAQQTAVDNLQLLATRGYAVLLPDIPLRHQGQVVADLLKIVLPGVDKVVDMGVADPARLGLLGHSFGGYNTIALLTETSRFKAAMMSAGEADLLASYGQLNPDGTTYGMAVIEHGQHLINATPWEHPERYLENSPILHLDRVTTPLLIVHGGNDSPHLAEEVFVGLRRLGREVVYAKYVGEEHHQAQWSGPNQLDYWTRLLAWFGAHLQPAASSGQASSTTTKP